MNELKPCPFCGGELKIDWSMSSQYWAYCPNEKCCFYETLIYDSVSELVEACNARAERTCHPIDYVEDEFYTHKAMETDEWFGPSAACSACGKYIPIMNYCPQCGAKVVE